jgi:hypothetical protein
MIKLNTIYSIDNGANSIIFTEGKKDSVTGTHNDENIHTIEAKTSNFGDALVWAIEDVLHCLRVNVNNEDYDEEWGNYSKNYEKMAETINDQESYNNPLIE